jgi:hypothetical protein
MIRFHNTTVLYVVNQFDEATDTVIEDCQETFKAGELVSAEIVSENADYCELQFGDGGCSYNVPRGSFEVIE